MPARGSPRGQVLRWRVRHRRHRIRHDRERNEQQRAGAQRTRQPASRCGTGAGWLLDTGHNTPSGTVDNNTADQTSRRTPKKRRALQPDHPDVDRRHEPFLGDDTRLVRSWVDGPRCPRTRAGRRKGSTLSAPRRDSPTRRRIARPLVRPVVGRLIRSRVITGARVAPVDASSANPRAPRPRRHPPASPGGGALTACRP